MIQDRNTIKPHSETDPSLSGGVLRINKAEGMASQKMKEELARESGFEDVSFATRSYRPEYASTPDIRGPYRRE